MSIGPNQLGCARNYQVSIVWSRPDNNVWNTDTDNQTFFQIPDVISVAWSRVLDDVSTATVVVASDTFSPDCCKMLAGVEPWVFSVAIYRDTEFVWIGPITKITFAASSTVTIEASDLFAYLEKSTPQGTILDLNIAAETYIDTLLVQAWNANSPDPDPWRIRANAIYEPTGVLVERDITPRVFYVGEEIRDLSRHGVDFTVVGHHLYVTKEKTRGDYTGSFPVLRTEDFSSGVQVVYFGAETANGVAVTATDGSWSFFDTEPSTQASYGPLWRIEDPGNMGPTEAANLMAASLAQRYITPRGLVVPADSALLPTANVTIEQLIPGLRFDVYASFGCAVVGDPLKLVRMDVAFNAGEEGPVERVAVSLVSIPEDPPA